MMRFFQVLVVFIYMLNLHAESWGQNTINLKNAWNFSQGEGIKVLVIDTGIDRDHPSIASNFVKGKNFTENSQIDKLPYEYFDEVGHGTHVAGIIAGSGEKNLGVAPQVKIYVAKACDARGCDPVNVIMAIEWGLTEGVDIINMSLGWEEGKRAGDLIFKRVKKQGIAIITAAGNNAESFFYSPGVLLYPANYPETISVGAIDQYFQAAPFSQYGKSLVLMAPGVDIESAVPVGTGRKSSLNYVVNAKKYKIENKVIESFVLGNDSIDTKPIDIGYGAEKDFKDRGIDEIKGKIVLIRRGQEDFAQMAIRSKAYGARGLIVVENLKEGITDCELRDGNKVILSSIPTLIISKNDGAKMFDDIANLANISITIKTVKTDYALKSGTSFAAPYVTGVIALMRSIDPTLTVAEMKTILIQTADPLSVPEKTGAGLLDAYKAVAKVFDLKYN